MNELSAHPAATFRGSLMVCKHHTRDTDGFAEFSRSFGRALHPLFRQFCKIDPPMIVVPPMKEGPWINTPFPQVHEVSLSEMLSVKDAFREGYTRPDDQKSDRAAGSSSNTRGVDICLCRRHGYSLDGPNGR
ncbi:hypothetical protein Q3C01_14355 [Bradyrhizobium sp. UFLA05-109]